MSVLSAVLYTTSNCPNCGPVKEALADFNEQYKEELYVRTHVVDKNASSMQSAREWGVSGVPTILFFKEGRHLETVIGGIPRGELGEIIERNIQRDVLSEASGGESNTSSSVLCGVSEQENASTGSD